MGNGFVRVMASMEAAGSEKEVAADAFRIHGSYGCSKSFEIERIYRDALSLLSEEGTVGDSAR